MNCLDQDTPLVYYKALFPGDKHAQDTVMKLLLNTANKITGTHHIDLENIESEGLSKAELDIYTLIQIDALSEPELEYAE